MRTVNTADYYVEPCPYNPKYSQGQKHLVGTAVCSTVYCLRLPCLGYKIHYDR
jgi:hypothetical protein